MRNLLPDTAYEYRVSDAAGTSPIASETFQTRTAPAPGPGAFSFAFLCDTGIIGRPDGRASGTAQIIEEIIADDPLFVLGGGDYAYADRDGRFTDVSDAIDAWFTQIQPLIARHPFMAQYGNHEVLLGERFRDWAPRFAQPEGSGDGKSYSFDVGEAHFSALFVPEGPPGADQLAWLASDLAAARDRGTRWLIVYQHEPIYGHGHSHPAKREVRKFLAPIFDRHSVDLHLSGHDQNYERTYPILGARDVPVPTSRFVHEYNAGEGVIYAKVSPGGKMSDIGNDFSRFRSEQQPSIAVRDDTAHHYALVDVRPQELIVNVYSVGGDGERKALLDSFRIKGSE